jgi:hypothetical protein
MAIGAVQGVDEGVIVPTKWKRVTFSVNEDMYAALKERAAQRNHTIAGYLLGLVDEALGFPVNPEKYGGATLAL